MKEILECMIKNLVEDKASVSINEIAQGSEINYEIRVNEKDMGRVIGKKGKIAQSIRTVMRAVAAKENKKVKLEFID
ncbi:MAG: KH domain-containing protein [Clostridia bacterium]|nr:KH domain-containing protein [Clostridia bacterium]